MAIHRRERLSRNLHILVVIHRKVISVAGTRPQRRDAQNVDDELKLAAVPGENHGAGT